MARYLGGLSWKELAKRVAHKFSEDKVLDQSAELAFYFLLALFPLLIFLVSIVGLVASGSSVQTHVVHWLTQAMPSSASGLVRNVVQQTTQGSGGGKLSFGILFALWSASSGMAAVIVALDSAFEVKEKRSWVRQRLTALWLTVAIGFLMLAAIGIVLFGSRIAIWLGTQAGIGGFEEILWRVVQWPVAVFFVIVAFALVYRYAPNKRKPAWKWITPGAVVGVLLWLIASFGFREYLSYFNTYESTYGSLGVVIILMMWFYVTAIALLLGAEVEARVEAAAKERDNAGNQPSARSQAGEFKAA